MMSKPFEDKTLFANAGFSAIVFGIALRHIVPSSAAAKRSHACTAGYRDSKTSPRRGRPPLMTTRVHSMPPG